MCSFSSPYNFVPVAPFVLLPEWASQVSHDHPFEDGLSGEIDLELINTTPLCVGGKQKAGSEEKPGFVYVYRTPDKIPAIPGSSLKGMLRNALAPIVFARMSQVEDRKLSVRDISSRGSYYYKTIVQKDQNAGWLRFHEGRWQLKPCDFVRIYQGDIINYFKLNTGKWKKIKTAKARYMLFKKMPEIKFDIEPMSRIRAKAIDLGRGPQTGSLVMTGQPGRDFESGPTAKQWEFIFYDSNSSKQDWHEVPKTVLKDFLFVHKESDDWNFLRAQGHGREEIPVFYHGDPEQITSMGLAFMYRLAQKNSLHDALNNVSKQHLNSEQADFIELLFGRIKPADKKNSSEVWSLRGRVNIGLFEAVNLAVTDWQKDTVLSSPKPSFYPAYLQQPEIENPHQQNNKRFKTLDSVNPQLRGWKRYPVKPEKVLPPPRINGREVSNKVKICLETVNSDTSFNGKIRFHNLRPVELGALLWILDFGGKENLRHSLGMGKPYGLGQVKIRIKTDSSNFIPNDRTSLKGIDCNQLFEAARNLFVSYMDKVWQQVIGEETKFKAWENSPQVCNMLAMADMDEGDKRSDYLNYMELKGYSRVKTNIDSLHPYYMYSDVKWNNNIFTQPVVVSNSQSLDVHLREIEFQRQEREKKFARENAKLNMKKGDLLLTQIQERLDALNEQESLSRSSIKNLEGK